MRVLAVIKYNLNVIITLRKCNFHRISAVIHPGGNNALNPEGDL